MAAVKVDVYSVIFINGPLQWIGKQIVSSFWESRAFNPGLLRDTRTLPSKRRMLLIASSLGQVPMKVRGNRVLRTICVFSACDLRLHLTNDEAEAQKVKGTSDPHLFGQSKFYLLPNSYNLFSAQRASHWVLIVFLISRCFALCH